MGDLEQQTAVLMAALVGAAVIDLVLLAVWGYRRFVRDMPTFAPRWSAADIWFSLHLVLLLLVLLVIPLMIALAFVPGVKMGSAADMTNPLMLLYFALPATILQNVACFLVPAGFIWFKYGERLRDIGLPPVPSRRDVAAGLVVGVLALLVAQGIGTGLQALAQQFQDFEAIRRMLEFEKTNPVAQITKILPTLGIPGLVLALITIGVSAPLGEEMLFRGFAMNALTRRFGGIAGLVLSSVMFAAPHTYSPIGLSVVFLMGLGLGWTYRNSGSLWVPIIIHATNNSALVLVAYFFPGLNV
jgi:Predicted metal-dependent membrane protease